MNKLSIITVVKDDPEALAETTESVRKHAKVNYEHIIWIYPTNLDQYDMDDIANDSRADVFIEDDKGIFDAMNKATRKASGNCIMYLNAGDKFISDVVVQPEKECLIKVFYHDFRGKYKEIKKKKTIRMGIPYCHQGIIFENQGIVYPLQKFASDYVVALRNIKDWTEMNFIPGTVYYRNDGVSAINRQESDNATAAVIKNEFGRLNAMLFLIKSHSKLALKTLHRVFKRMNF